MVSICALGIIFAYAVLRFGAVLPSDSQLCIMLLGFLGIWHGRAPGRVEKSSALESWLKWPIGLLLVLAFLQLLPLSREFLQIISPARARLVENLKGVVDDGTRHSLSVFPAATFEGMIRFAAYVAVFLVVRDTVHRSGEPIWRFVAPLICIAAVEAAAGLCQFAAGVPVRGTYVNRNHFGGMLDMVFPLALMCSVHALRGLSKGGSSSRAWAARACLGSSATALTLAGILCSLSRTAFLVVLISLICAWGLSIRKPSARSTRFSALGLIVAGVFAFLVFITPAGLASRFARLMIEDSLSTDVRLQTWRQTSLLIADYPLFGCGLGAYESAFAKYQNVAPDKTINYAHNEFLEFGAEMGLVGMALAVVPVLGLLHVTFATIRESIVKRDAAVACMVSIIAIGVHGMFDFSLHIPANAIGAAWIAGAAAGLAGDHALSSSNRV